MDAVEQSEYELILHPAYSPDLAPSDYFLFPNLRKDIRGRHFRSNEEVVAAVEEWVRDKDPGFFSSGLMALEHRWSKCIILEGNYIGKEKIHLTQKYCLFDLGLTSLSTFFSHIATVSGCGRELNAHF